MGTGIWLTLLACAPDPESVGVLALRLGLAAAAALEPFAEATVRLKWPNDLYVGTGKLAGILVEARWRDGAAEWAALGLGINVVAPTDVPSAAGLRGGTSRLAVLERLVPALRRAASATGMLRDEELAAFAARDLARGRACSAPVPGRVAGLARDGSLVVDAVDGPVAVRSGSLVLAGA